MACSLTTYTRGSYPRVSYCTIAERILGKGYELSIALVGDARAQAINKKHRKKEYVPNVLSFPLSDTSGEIILNPRKACAEAKQYGHTPTEHIAFLLIHGCLHLKGHDHGPVMESQEKRYMKSFGYTK